MRKTTLQPPAEQGAAAIARYGIRTVLAMLTGNDKLSCADFVASVAALQHNLVLQNQGARHQRRKHASNRSPKRLRKVSASLARSIQDPKRRNIGISPNVFSIATPEPTMNTAVRKSQKFGKAGPQNFGVAGQLNEQGYTIVFLYPIHSISFNLRWTTEVGSKESSVCQAA